MNKNVFIVVYYPNNCKIIIVNNEINIQKRSIFPSNSINLKISIIKIDTKQNYTYPSIFREGIVVKQNTYCCERFRQR